MFKTKLHIIIVGLIVLVASGCKKESHPPTAPEIKYENFTFASDSTTGLLTFYYHDLNGDIGLKENEVDPPYDFDLFVTYYEKVNGVFVKDTTVADSLFWYRIPYIEPEGVNKEIDGTVTIRMEPLSFNPFTPNDTFKYTFYIIDRALMKSNVAESEELIKP
jgi:hypothetical protein